MIWQYWVQSSQYVLEMILSVLKYIGGFYIIFYLIPYTVRRAWGEADLKTKKFCDSCFRDIKKVNQLVEEGKL